MHATTDRRFELKALRPRAAWTWLVGPLLALLLAGCAGGSGSSGFDIAAENMAIQDALDSNQCEIFEGLTICPAASPPPRPTPTNTAPLATPSETPTETATPTRTGTRGSLTMTPAAEGTPTTTTTPVFGSPTPTGTALGATATPTNTRPSGMATITPQASFSPTATGTPGAPRIETNVSPSDSLPCFVDTDTTCTLLFVFQPIGLASSNVYFVAFRQRNPDSDWTVVAAPEHRVALENTSTQDPAQQYQFAVLVYASDPGFVPETVTVLSDTGADSAYVTPAATLDF